MKRSKLATGFTMVEVLIVVAIVGILAAVALPRYLEYSIRSKVTECLNFTMPAKLIVAERQTGSPSEPMSFSQTRYCADVRVAGNGAIVLVTQDTGAKESPVLQLLPQGSGENLRWTCQYVAGEPAHVPPSCRTKGELVAADSVVETPAAPVVAEPGPDFPPPADSGGDAAAGSSGAGGSGGAGGDAAPAGDGGADGVGAEPGPVPAVEAPAADDPGSGAADGDAGAGGSAGGVGGVGGVGDGAGGGSGADGGGEAVGVDPGAGTTIVPGPPTGGVGGTPGDTADDKDKDKEDEKPVGECPHKLPSGKPHPGKCKDWPK